MGGREPSKRRRIAFLQKAPSGHTDSCLRALARTEAAELFVTIPPTLRDSPFDADSRTWIDVEYRIADLRKDDGLLPALQEFQPELLIVVGWEQHAYRRAARALRSTSRRVVCMDQQYHGTLKQRAGIISSGLYLKPYFDGAFVAGGRQRAFAARLGFPQERIMEGFYSCDTDLFTQVSPLNAGSYGGRRAFIYVGRLAAEKRIDDLAEAYEVYRRSRADPWDLVVVGTGDSAARLRHIPGVRLEGFVQPAQLPEVFATAACLVLPSSFEPWGVVVHEAATAGLGLICTSAVGAADLFLRDGENGRVVAVGRPAVLAEALRWAHDLPPEDAVRVSTSSRSLAAAMSPGMWAQKVLAMLEWRS